MNQALLKCGLLGSIVILAIAITYIGFESFFISLWDTWRHDSFYQHGIFVAAISLILVILNLVMRMRGWAFAAWLARRAALYCHESPSPHPQGRSKMVLFVLSLLAFYLGIKTHVMFLGGIAFSLWMIALTKISFPWLYFLTAVPLPYLNEFSGIMQIWISKITAILFHALGYPIVASGITLQLPKESLVIAADCTGIKSWLVLFSLVVFFIYFIPFPTWKKIASIILVFPIAMLSNLIRVLVLTYVASTYGVQTAMYFWHDFAGAVFYGVACALVILCVMIMKIYAHD